MLDPGDPKMLILGPYSGDPTPHTRIPVSEGICGAAAAAALVAQMGRRTADARTLSYRLFEIATQKGWSAEALVYNALAQEWSNLEDRAAEAPARSPAAAQDAQLRLAY
jgi:putative DNA methylase